MPDSGMSGGWQCAGQNAPVCQSLGNWAFVPVRPKVCLPVLLHYMLLGCGLCGVCWVLHRCWGEQPGGARAVV